MDVLGHHGDALGVESAQVVVFEHGHEVRLGYLLQGEQGGELEADVDNEVLAELADQALEGGLANQQRGRPLVY